MMNIVLFEPEIPQNTGNIGRTCVATGTRLHLIGPMGFQITEKAVKRAGMDYWKKIRVQRFIWRPPRQNRDIQMFRMRKIVILCLARRAPEFRRRF